MNFLLQRIACPTSGHPGRTLLASKEGDRGTLPASVAPVVAANPRCPTSRLEQNIENRGRLRDFLFIHRVSPSPSSLEQNLGDVGKMLVSLLHLKLKALAIKHGDAPKNRPGKESHGYRICSVDVGSIWAGDRRDHVYCVLETSNVADQKMECLCFQAHWHLLGNANVLAKV
jgi:hypothetical protein